MGDITQLRNKYGPGEMSFEDLAQNSLNFYQKLYKNEQKLSDLQVQSNDNIPFYVHSYILTSQR